VAIDFTAVFRAVADFTGVDRAAKTTSDKLKGMGAEAEASGKKSGTFGENFSSSMDKVSKKAGKVGKDMSLGVTAPVVLLGTKAVQSFAAFESSIVAAGAKSGATKDQIEAMKNVALDMGAKTKFSAGEAATAMDNMAAAGFDANGVMAAIPGVMLAAQAAGEDLGLTADVTAKAINAFGLKASDATHVADVFTTASNNSAIGMQGLSDALGQAGELGAKAGQGLEDVVAMISRLVDQGVPAASAGVAVRQSITSLLAPTKRGSKILDELGLSFRDAQGNMLPIPDILDKLTSGMSSSNPLFTKAAAAAGLSGKAYKDWAQKVLFGVEGSKAITLSLSKGKPLLLDTAKDTEKLAQLTAGLAKTMGGPAAAAWVKAHTANGKFVASGADAVRAMGAMGKASDGTAKKIGDIMSDTTAARIDQLGGSFETLAIRIVTAVAPALQDILVDVTNLVNKFAGFAKANPEITKIGVAFLLAAAAIGPMLIIVGKMAAGLSVVAKVGGTAAKGIGLFGKAFGVAKFAPATKGVGLFGKAMFGLGKAFSFIGKAMFLMGKALLTNPIFLIITLIAVAAFLIIKNWSTVKAFLIKAWAAIGSVAASVWGAIKGFFSTIWDGVVGVWKSVWGAISSFFATIWGAIVTAVKWYFGLIVKVITTYVNIWKTIITTVLNVIMAIWRGFWSVFGGLITAVWDLIVAVVKLYLAILFGVINTITGAIVTAAKAIWNGLVSFLTTVWNGIVATAKAIWGALSKAASTAWTAIKTAVMYVVNLLKAGLTTAWSAIKTAAAAVWTGIKTAAALAWKGIQTAIIAPVKAVWGLISGPLKTLGSNIAAAWNAIKTAAGKAWDAVSKVVTDKVAAIANIAGKIKDKVVGALKGAGSWLYDAGKKIVTGLIDGITSMIDKLTGTINNLTGKISKFFPGSPVKEGPLKVLNRGYAGGQITKMLASGVDDGSRPLLKTFQVLTSGVQKQVQAMGKATLPANQVRTVLSTKPMAALSHPQRVAGMPVAAARGAAMQLRHPPANDTQRGPVVHLTVNNPTGETSAETVTKQMSRLSVLGMI
jgi:TP901 family phage tail tape measure protein